MIGQDSQNVATPQRYSDVIRGDVAPPREENPSSRTPSLLTSGSKTPSPLIPGLRSASPVEPDLKRSSSVVSSASRCLPMLRGYELEGTPSMPGDLQISTGLKPKVYMTHLEVMAVIHPVLEMDGMDSDASEPSPTAGKGDRDDMDDNRSWTTVNHKGHKSRSVSHKKQRRPETLDVKLGCVVHEVEKCLTPDDCNRINKCIIALKNKLACRQSNGTSEMALKGEGPSTLEKGKGVDLHNWGALSDVGENVDLDKQRTALELWNLARDLTHLSVESSDEESSGTHLLKEHKHSHKSNKCNERILTSVKTGSPPVLLGGPGGQRTSVEVSPDTSGC